MALRYMQHAHQPFMDQDGELVATSLLGPDVVAGESTLAVVMG